LPHSPAASCQQGSSTLPTFEPHTVALQVYEPVHLVVEDTGCAAGNVSVLVGATRVLAVTGGSGAQQELYWRFTSPGAEVLKVGQPSPAPPFKMRSTQVT